MLDDTTNQIRVLPVNFNGIFQDAIKALLGREAGMIVLPQKVSCETICPVGTNERPDVLLFDLDNCPHGQDECLLSMRSIHPKAHILILAGAFELALFRAAIGAGAHGVVLKADPGTILIEAIHQVYRGQLWLSYEIASQLMVADTEAAPRSFENEAKVERGARLTLREREVLALICEGYKDQEVADRIGIRMPTVRAHLASIYLKLDIRDRLNLVIYSYRHGLATCPTPPINAGREFDEEHGRKEPRARLYVAAKKSA